MAENSKEGAYRQKSRSRRSTPRTQAEKRQQKCDHHQKNSLWLCPQLERESHIIHRGSFKVKSYLLLYKLSVRIFSWVMASIIPEIIVCILRFRTGQLTWHGGQKIASSLKSVMITARALRSSSFDLQTY